MPLLIRKEPGMPARTFEGDGELHDVLVRELGGEPSMVRLYPLVCVYFRPSLQSDAPPPHLRLGNLYDRTTPVEIWGNVIVAGVQGSVERRDVRRLCLQLDAAAEMGVAPGVGMMRSTLFARLGEQVVLSLGDDASRLLCGPDEVVVDRLCEIAHDAPQPTRMEIFVIATQPKLALSETLKQARYALAGKAARGNRVRTRNAKRPRNAK